MAALGREQARAIVEHICKSKGGVTRARREALSASDPDVLKSIDSLREQLGTLIKVFAKDLYNTDTRFVFELIQNAEDNKYQKATSEPCLTFKLYPDKVVVESNEDGFDEDNVRAICAVGHSTKKEQQGYVGEKGIGLESVFRVASNVHIQSGPFSSYCDHKKGDSGMGMLMPFNQEHDGGVPASVRTRMTLKLAAAAYRERLLGGFSQLSDSLLMFLTKIKKLIVATFDAICCLSKVIYSYETKGQRGRLTKYSEFAGSPGQETMGRYLLPKDTARPKTSQVEVVLAFPVDPDSTPILKLQHVFAYLPVRQAGFSFLIQSDFITGSNREDIPSSQWNLTIRSGIAEKYRDAVLQFCQHATLQSNWMRYLPSNNIPGPFWDQLPPKTLSVRKEIPILRPWSGGTLKRPHQLKWLANDTVDQDGDPLFDHVPEKLYLSRSYNWSNKQTLDQRGVGVISMSEVLIRVRADLSRPSSDIRSVTTGGDWHNRSAKLLMIPLDNQWPAEVSQVQKLALIPLQDGSWVSGDSGPIFNPYNGTIPVPTNLGLRLVDPSALQTHNRKTLFSRLGVKGCLPKDVINKIVARYMVSAGHPNLQSSIMHLRYLYWKLREGDRWLKECIYIMDHELVPVYRQPVTAPWKKVVDDLYLEFDEEYGPKQLLSELENGNAIQAPGHSAYFINSAYLDAVSAHAIHNHMTWTDWLLVYAQVQAISRPVNPSSKTISDVFLYIIRHRNDKLVGTLKAHWSSYVVSMKNSGVVEALSKACVPCDHVADTPLEDTYMPLPKLKQICNELGVAEKLPFLQLPTDLSAGSEKDWNFLGTFHVGHEADLTFYLEILRVLVEANKDLSFDLSVKAKRDIFRVYEEIEKHSKADDRDDIEVFFIEHQAIYIPARGPCHAVWAGPEECVWKAPGFFDQSFPLAAAEGYQNNDRLTRLFNVLLKIRDTGYTHYMAQLQAQQGKPVSLATISDIYRHIFLDIPDETAWSPIREQFEKSSLVYVNLQKGWHPPSSCLWTDDTRILGKFAIATQYTDFHDLFVGRMGVPRPDVSMFVDELVRLGKSDKPPLVSQVRDLIRDINSLGPTEEALTDLRLSNILPIKGMDGRTSLRNTTDIFAIVDRHPYGDLFRAKLPVLDFGFGEIHELRPFLSALSLGDRYMTQAIKERTTANGSVIDPMLSRQMREKAYALFRCAVHYGVARPQDPSLYHRLLATDVYRSRTIIRSITISLSGTQTTVDGAIANLHIEDDVSQIRFYVPQDEEARELCYLLQIPGSLVSHLKITDPGAAKVIGDLVKTTRASVLDQLLEEHGIVSVPGVEPLSPVDLEVGSDAGRPDLVDPQPTVNYPGRSSTTSGRGSSSSGYRKNPSPSFTDYRASTVDEDSPAPTTYSIGRGHGTPLSSVSPSPLRSEEGVVSRQLIFRDLYLDLLDHVIATAARASFPHYYPATPAPVADTEPNALRDDVFGKGSDGQMTHDMRIGAAGELYAFEILLKQDLVGFGRDNWKSPIRDKVCVHEKYRDMEPWRGAETADIVYNDVGPDYKLTKLLETRGFPLRGANSPVTYYLQVKTTKGECGTRLFVSRAQYKKMRRMRLRVDRPSSEIYIILRVFNFGKANMGMRLYVDPATMKKDGELIFEPESYTVASAAIANPLISSGPGKGPDEEL